jgi:hypothetical protein
MQPWEFDERLDSKKSYQAFCYYRDLGPNRSLDAAYRLYKPQSSGKRVAGFFQDWSGKAQWTDRCKAFDLENDRIHLEKHRQNNHAEHDQRIEDVRRTIEVIAMNNLTSSAMTSKLIRASIEQIELRSRHTNEQGKIYFELSAKDASLLGILINCKNKDATTVVTAIDHADQSLGIRQLQERLQNG